MKQTNRWVRAHCAECKYIARVSRFLLLKYGSPYCPKCYKQLKHPPISCTFDYVRHDYHQPEDMVDALVQAKIAAQKEQIEAIRKQNELERQVRERVYAESERKRREESAAEWEEWKKLNPDYRPPVFVDPYEEDRKRRAALDAEVAEFMAQRHRAQEEAHAAFEAAEAARWKRIGEMLERMEQENAAKAASEPEPVAPQPERRHYGREHIRELLANRERTEELLQGRKKRQVRLVDDDPQRGTVIDDPVENDPSNDIEGVVVGNGEVEQ